MFILTALNFGAQFKEFALRLFCTGSGICLQCMQNEIWFDSSPYVVSKSIPIHALVRACFGCRTESTCWFGSKKGFWDQTYFHRMWWLAKATARSRSCCGLAGLLDWSPQHNLLLL